MPKGKPKRSATKKRSTKGGAAPAKTPSSESQPAAETEAKPTNEAQAAPKQRMQVIVTSLAAVLLVLLVIIAFFAPDPTSTQGKPSFHVLMWRLLFLLIPLGIMYGLLWGDKALKWLRR